MFSCHRGCLVLFFFSFVEHLAVGGDKEFSVPPL
jgi:hypothetical protein